MRQYVELFLLFVMEAVASSKAAKFRKYLVNKAVDAAIAEDEYRMGLIQEEAIAEEERWKWKYIQITLRSFCLSGKRISNRVAGELVGVKKPRTAAGVNEAKRIIEKKFGFVLQPSRNRKMSHVLMLGMIH